MWDCSDNLAAAIPAVASSATVDFPKLAEVHVLAEMLTPEARRRNDTPAKEPFSLRANRGLVVR
jgi:hypothetical protein